MLSTHLYSINNPKFGGNFPGVPRPLQLFASFAGTVGVGCSRSGFKSIIQINFPLHLKKNSNN